MKSPQFKEQNELLRALRKQLEAADMVLHSRSWRLTYPLRWLAGKLRSLRARALSSAVQKKLETVSEPELPSEREQLFADHRVPLRVLLSSGVTLRLPSSEAPEISVVLVLNNRAELTLACLRSLCEHPLERLEITLIDNASSDDTSRLLEHTDGARIIRNDQKHSYPAAANQAARHARGRYLLLLSHEAQLLSGSLVSALAMLRRCSDVGTVCGRIIGFDGLLQEAGKILWNDGTCSDYGGGDDPLGPMYMFRRDVDACSATFLLIPRRVWERLGGFDETFADSYYSEDWCIRLYEDRLRIVYDPKAVVLRLSSDSSSTGSEDTTQREYRETFSRRHSRFLANQSVSNPGSVVKARSRDGQRKHLLILDDRVPHFWLGSGFPRARSILLSILKQGYLVTFYPLVGDDEDWSTVYSDMPDEVEFMMGWGRFTLEAFLRNRRGYYDTIFVSRPHNMSILRPIAVANPNWFKDVRIVYDAEALFAGREIARRELHRIPCSQDEIARLIQNETSLASSADLVISVSEGERATFSKYGIEHVQVLGHTLVPKPSPRPFDQRKGFLFVGAIVDETEPNADSIIWFLAEIWPKIVAELGESAVFTIAGANNSEKIRRLAGPSVRVLGFVKELAEFYDSAKVFVAPTRYAAGIPHKVHEAAAHGLPVVATPLLAAQLGWRDGVEFAVGSGVDSFAQKCIELYSDEAVWTRLRLTALERIEVECSPEAFEKRLKEILSVDCGRHRSPLH